MKVLEIKNNLVKIAFDAEDNLALGGFIIIEDSNNPYVAQVMNLKSDPSTNYAIVKLLFTFNDEGILKNYNGTIPSLNAKVSKLPSSELLDIIPAEEPIILGSLAQQDVNLSVDKTILENNLLICSNNLSNTTTLLNNIIGQVKEKCVIIDTEGQFEWDKAISLGNDFKLPLNIDSINYIYENDLEDVDAVSKAMIQDIFIELQNYIQTLPEKFLPFDTFINVIDSQYRETQIPQLILLKNKLLKYKELNVFAQNLKDILDLSMIIENAKNVSIDLSEIPQDLQKEVIRYIYTVLNGINEQIYCFVKVNNSNVTKKLLKKYITRDNVFTTIVCPHEFKYIEEVKEASQNIIFFAPLTVQHDFSSYNSFLNKLNSDEFVIYGAHTQNIPFITELNVADDNKSEEDEPEQNEEVKDEQVEQTEHSEEIDDIEDIVEADDEEEQFPEINYPEIESSEIIEEPVIEENIDSETTELEDDVIVEDDENLDYEEDIVEEDVATDDDVSTLDSEIQPVDNILDDTTFEPLDENTQLDEEYIDGEVVEDENQEISNDELVEQVAKDVDKAFYEKLPAEDDEFENSDDLTEDDLNLIDDLSTNEEISLVGGEDDLQELNSFEAEEQPPVVPIYPAEEDLEDDIQTFEAGDRVSTAKYGEGVVEKMIKYGNKMLCSIDFPNIGRRLLDPSMTEITKLS
jgi:hypothetical protein